MRVARNKKNVIEFVFLVCVSLPIAQLAAVVPNP